MGYIKMPFQMKSNNTLRDLTEIENIKYEAITSSLTESNKISFYIKKMDYINLLKLEAETKMSKTKLTEIALNHYLKTALKERLVID
jgi:hypothetical protein